MIYPKKKHFKSDTTHVLTIYYCFLLFWLILFLQNIHDPLQIIDLKNKLWIWQIQTLVV